MCYLLVRISTRRIYITLFATIRSRYSLFGVEITSSHLIQDKGGNYNDCLGLVGSFGGAVVDDPQFRSLARSM